MGLGRLLPRSLAARTALVLLAGFGIVQAGGLAIHTRDEVMGRRVMDDRYVGLRVMNIYRSVAETSAALRGAEIRHLRETARPVHLALDPGPDLGDLPPAPPPVRHLMRLNLAMMPMPNELRPSQIEIGGSPQSERYAFALELPDGTGWLNVAMRAPSQGLFADPTFPIAWLLMTLIAGLLTVWAVRRLTAPVRTLAEAADALGRDVNAPPLPEGGPTEVARAAAAFNTMADRIRRFVSDRTFLLTAIGHDLRTPITRLKLRCEFIDDDDLRTRFMADLDELEAMVSATLAFGRDTARAEPETPLDLAALLRTVVDDAADGRPAAAERIAFVASGDGHVTIRGRPIALKRTFSNLVGNAIAYGGSATVTLGVPDGGEVAVTVEDEGPGIPAEQFERVFEPFLRLETSRSRETGGTGLGLPIARNIVRAHGGEITLSNRAVGGLCARVVLPV
jgi:signal transduction histidine kinase